MPDAVHLQPVTAQGQQQPPPSQGLVRQQQRPLPQKAQGAHLPGRVRQGLGAEVGPQRRGKQLPGGLRRQHRDGSPGHVPQLVAAVVEGGEAHLPPGPVDAQPDGPPLHAPPGRRPEHHAQKKVSRPGGDEQHPQVHLGVEYPPLHRHPAGEKAQGQHTARHAAGEGEQQQRPPQEAPLPAKGDGRHEKPRRQLPRQACQAPQPRQEHRRGVAPAEKRRRQAAPAPGRQAGEQLRPPQQQVIHQRVEEKHAVQVHHRHPAPPFSLPHYSGPAAESASQKGDGQKEPEKERRPA